MLSALAGLLSAAPVEDTRSLRVSPLPGQKGLRSGAFIQFHFISQPLPDQTVTLSFQQTGSKSDPASCTLQIAAGTRRVTTAPEAKSYCSVSPKASLQVGPDGTLVAAIPIAFTQPGHYRLRMQAGSSPWAIVGDYQLDASFSDDMGIQILGVTPTQAVLAFQPPSDTDTCTVQVTSTKSGDDWDFSRPVPDTDPNLFPESDNAELYDRESALQNRGFALADGTRAIVIGRRAAEYSPNTYRMHSRALQAATPHEAWISCGGASATLDFSTANVMPGVTFQDPLPADPDRPGDYAYPTLSWTDRNDSAIDPQTGLLMRALTFPSDSFLNPGFGEWKGVFGAPIAAFPARSLPATTVFLPAGIPKVVPSYFHFEVNESRIGWQATDASLTSFLPASLSVTCPLCVNTPVTVCLTSDGVTCAYDRNVAGDAGASPDPNTKQRGVLGTTINCTASCTFPIAAARWKDSTPVLSAWHPNYRDGTPNTVLPSFQFDSVKLRTTQVSCSNSAIVQRGVGAPFVPTWSKGTPVDIDGTRYTVNLVYDENSILLNESCPASAKLLTADTFGLLVTSPVQITRVASDGWRAKLQRSLLAWDAAGDLTNFTNCSRQPVFVNGKAGWHCVVGYSAYWIASDASTSLPLGVTGINYRADHPETNTAAFCSAAFWDDADGNNLICMYNTPDQPGKKSFAQLTFRGDHKGLEKAQFTHPDGGAETSHLPICTSVNPPSPNNCWSVTVLKKTGTNTMFVLEDAIRDAAPDAWKNSAFPLAIKDGAIYSFLAKLDDNHYSTTTWISQNSYGFSSVLEYSMPRGSVALKAVLPSWTSAPNAPAESTRMLRWSGIHNTTGVPWGTTKVGVYPTFFRGCCSPGSGPYSSFPLETSPIPCPPGSTGNCLSITLDGQPGAPNPTPYDPINLAKTRKPGTSYLTDILPGDLMCAPLNDDYLGYCFNFIQNGRFEHFKVLTTTTDADGTVIMTVQRNYAGTLPMPLPPTQRMFMLPAFCNYGAGDGCTDTATVFDWAKNTVEQVDTGGAAHQFTAYDAANQQVISVTSVANLQRDPSCYSSTTPSRFGPCYGVFGGKTDPAKPINSQLASIFTALLPLNPPFGIGMGTQGVTGIGVPNDVDSHPGAHQMRAAPNSEKVWYVDGRPFLGNISPIPPPVPVSPDVYRFAAPTDGSADATIEKYKRLPMLGSCGGEALRETTRISARTRYTYCVALGADDCIAGSNPGDAYVSCPEVRPSAKPSNACPFGGFGTYTPEVRDTCLSLTSGLTMGLTQTAFASQSNGTWTLLPGDRRLRSTRLLTHGFARYRILDPYLNPKTTPDGGVLLMRAMFVAGYATRVMMVKLPPFPDVMQDPLDRRGFVPSPVGIDPAPEGTSSVKVQFGYDAKFRCMTRPEECEARADFDATGLSTPYYFASETGGPAGLNCDGGTCPAAVSLPGISQRVVFYRAVYLVNDSPVYGPTRVTVVPDPVAVN